MTKRQLSKNVKEAIALLDQHYLMYDKCYLDYDEKKPWQLLFATILSAQCTDDRVNIVTKTLFKKYETLEDFANAPLEDMENDVRTTGFFHNKARALISSAEKILKDFSGNLPNNMEDLLKLSGVGRKTANVVLAHVYNVPSIIVDTHVKRISGKLGFSKSENPDKIEFELMEIIPKSHWVKYNTQIIAHGRAVCKARNPNCSECFLSHICVYRKVNGYEKSRK